jgi:branched-chain amino acid transport system ATP-binding protein
MSETLLEVEGLHAAYGDARALHGVSLSLPKGETLALIGANGAGKSTLLKAICGLVTPTQGRIAFKGEDITARPANRIVGLGVALVPEGRRLFPSLSVEENLILGAKAARKGPWSLSSVYNLFPVLKERRHQPATAMSGGQQQMCAIGRALMSNPELLLLDELSLGLAPVVIKDIYDLLPRVIGEGMSAILVEQDVTRALASASRFLCLQEGRASLAGEPRAHSREDITRAYFGT